MKNLCLTLTILISLALAGLSSLWAINQINNSSTKSAPQVDFDSISKRIAQATLNTARLVKAFERLDQTNAVLKQLLLANNSNQFYISSINHSILKLDQLVKKTGLETFATNIAIEASILSEAVKKADYAKKRRQNREKMIYLEKAQSREDLQKYGATFGEIIKKKLEQRHFSDESQQIIDVYPNSYLAGKIIVRRSLDLINQNKLQEAEQNYAMLVQHNLTDTVVDNEIAEIALSKRFALKYIENKDWAKASQAVERLAQNTDEILVHYKHLKGLVSIPEVVKDLRKKIYAKDNN